jgi:hypothetical protein
MTRTVLDSSDIGRWIDGIRLDFPHGREWLFELADWIKDGPRWMVVGVVVMSILVLILVGRDAKGLMLWLIAIIGAGVMLGSYLTGGWP